MKLEVPAPDEDRSRDETRLSDELWIGIVLSALVAFFGWFVWVEPQRVGEPDPFAAIEDPEEREYLRDRSEFEAMVESEGLARVDWSDETDRAARLFEVGPRQAAEFVCRQLRDSPGLDQIGRPSSLALLQQIDRRSSDTPWTCLLDALWRGELPDDREFSAEIEAFWEEVRTLQRHGSLMADVIDTLLDEGELPETTEFDRWLERCALSFNYAASPRCQRALQRRSAEGAGDLLLLANEILERPELSRDDLFWITDSLVHLARSGQPESWRILETEKLPDYDVDFRLAALFKLCRIMHSPDEEIHMKAARALSEVSGYRLSPTTPHIRYRWRSSCRLAFGDPDHPGRRIELLHVAYEDDDGDVVVDYGLSGAIDRGHCEKEEGMPIWFCGADRWTGGNRPLSSVMGDYFALTAHANWYELDYLPQDWD